MYTMNSITSKNWVDTHFHVFNAGEAFASARYVPQYTASLQDWMAISQGVGVTRGVCVQPSFLGVDNRLMVGALKAHPDVLRGVAVLAADTHADELNALHAVGVRGIRLRQGDKVIGMDVVDKIQEEVDELRDVVAGRFDLFLDVGCFQGLDARRRAAMGREVTSLASPGATLLLLAFQPTRWQRLVEGAKREKELTFYASIPTDDITVLVATKDIPAGTSGAGIGARPNSISRLQRSAISTVCSSAVFALAVVLSISFTSASGN